MNVDDRFHITTKLFELAHINPPTHRLLTEAMPLMQKLSMISIRPAISPSTVRDGRSSSQRSTPPSGMGFSVRVGAELDVLVSASGRVLLAFQDEETRQIRIEESLDRRPEQADPQIGPTLDTVRARGFESIPSVQVRGLYAVSFPIMDSRGHAIAALTVPYAESIDKIDRKSIAIVEETLGATAETLSRRMGGAAARAGHNEAQPIAAMSDGCTRFARSFAVQRRARAARTLHPAARWWHAFAHPIGASTACGDQLAACAGMSRWCFMTILLSAPR